MCYFYSNENGYAATIFSPDLNKTKSLFVETFLLIYTEIVPFAKELIRELWNTVSNSLLLSIINYLMDELFLVNNSKTKLF